MKHLVLLFLFLSLGIAFRLWFISLVPQPFVFDQEEYYRFAVAILEKGIYSESARLYGYPVFLTPIIAIFGEGNLFAVYVIQAVLDTVTAFLILLLGRMVFSNKRSFTPWIGALLYLVNPFTTSYAGVVLTETLSAFLLTLVFFLAARYALGEVPSGTFLGRGWIFLLLSSLFMGFLTQVRPSFIPFTIILLGIFLVRLLRMETGLRLRVAAMVIFLYLLPLGYTTIANARQFGQATPLTVDNLFVRELYISLFDEQTKEIQQMYDEYSVVPQNMQGRKDMSEKYLGKSFEIIQQNPSGFIKNRFIKMWNVWQKHEIFPYTPGQFGYLSPLLFTGNIVVILLGLGGFVSRFYQLKGRKHNEGLVWFFRMVGLLFFYVTIFHTVTAADERYSLPAYPLVFLFAGYMVTECIHVLRNATMQQWKMHQ